MKQAVLIHGCCTKSEFYGSTYPSLSNSHWFPWLQKKLTQEGVLAQTPEMPNPYNPVYPEWESIFKQFFLGINMTLVGHSCGAGFLLRWLGENKVRVDKLILVAPWLDSVKRWPGFSDFTIDPSIQNRVDRIHILFSKDESVEGVKEAVDIISRTLPNAEFHTFENKGHFTRGDMGTDEFPELLEIILRP